VTLCWSLQNGRQTKGPWVRHPSSQLNVITTYNIVASFLIKMDFSPEGKADTDLGTLFNECLNNFKLLLHAISQRNTHSSSPTLRSVLIARAFDEYTRLKVWGHDFRAGLPDSTRSSLGESLRHDGELREQVEGMFATMNEQMKLGIVHVSCIS